MLEQPSGNLLGRPVENEFDCNNVKDRLKLLSTNMTTTRRRRATADSIRADSGWNGAILELVED
jgi:hypothetical protein